MTKFIGNALYTIRSLTFAVIATTVFFGIKPLLAAGEQVNLKMVFVPASEKGDESDYVSLLKIVEKLTGYKISSIKVTDYNAAVESMRADRAQIAWFGGKTYIVAAKIAYAEAFAAGIRKGAKDPTYNAFFVVRADGPIKTLEQVRGKTLALNSIGSTSGDMIPRVELSKIGLDTENRKDFKRVSYAGSHDACLLTVLNKHADVCGMSSRNYEARIEDGTIKANQVRIIHKSSSVPPPPLAYSTKLSQEVRNQLKKAVLNAHKHGKIGGYGGEMERYVEVKDADYDVLREVGRLLRAKKIK